ncbi:MAG TPA: NAD-dependent epimerase/dehydratase family protein [Patescibacteria group bacterium]|nr:NAD-dependent epimerase/dehydratase family protein [Patescibacteria group bacterium]
MKKISLVTGGAGFIGSHVADHLLKLGHKVIVIDDLSGGFLKNVNPRCEFIKESVTNQTALERVFNTYKINYVYHLAAYAAEGLSHFIRNFNYENNLGGSIKLINLAIKHEVEHFVFTSSIAVYGENQTPMIETLEPKPEDPYGIAKYAVELDLKAASKMFGLNYTIFRPHNVYGERQNYGDPYRNVLGIFINNLMQGRPMTIFGDGKQTRAFTYISDVAPYVALAVNTPQAKNEVINIGSSQPYSVLDLANMVAKAMKVAPSLEFLPARKEVVHAYPDHHKAKKIFNIKKTVNIKLGIRRMVNWALRNGPLQPKKFGNIEITKNLPPSWQKLV